MCLVCIFILVHLLEMVNTVWRAHAMVKVWKRTSMSSFLCPWTCHDFHLLTWRKEYSMSKKAILSVEYDFWSPLLSIEVCPAPRLKHMLWQQCWLCHPDPGGGPQCQILSGLWCFVFSCELLGAEHPQTGHGCLSVLSSICILHVVLLTT